MAWRSTTIGLKAGGLAGTISALVFSLWDWIENPGDIFRDASGTNWSIVLETGVSWLIPTFFVIGVSIAVVHKVWSCVRQ